MTLVSFWGGPLDGEVRDWEFHEHVAVPELPRATGSELHLKIHFYRLERNTEGQSRYVTEDAEVRLAGLAP